MDLMEYLLLFLKTVPLFSHPAWSNSSDSAFPSCWKYAYVQPVPENGDRSNPSSFCPIALICCLSKAFETILNTKFLKRLLSFNLLSDHQYGFRKGRSTGDLLAFLTDSWLLTLDSLLVVSVKLSLLP